MRFIKLFTFYLLGIFGIVCFSLVPQAVLTKTTSPAALFDMLLDLIKQLFNPGAWVYNVTWVQEPVDVPLMEVLWEPYLYSLQILLAAVFIGLSVAFLLALVTNFLPRLLLNPIKRLLDFLESVPDLVIAVLLQMFSIYIYKTFAVDIFRVASYREERAYLGPILTLSVLPAVSMYKILLLMIEQELLKDYVSFLQSKGLMKVRIITKHVMKNIMPSSFHHMKVIIWATLSSQFVIEAVYNIKGFTSVLASNLSPITITVALAMIFTPFYFFFQIVDLLITTEEIHTYSIDNRRFWDKWRPTAIADGIKRSLSNLLYGIRGIKLKKMKPWRPLIAITIIFFQHMKNWKFALGFLFFVFVISYSLIYSVTTNDHIDQLMFAYEEDGTTLKSIRPHEPPEPFLLGSDKFGYSLLDQLVIGAKYTLFFGLLIAVLRVLFGLIFGIFYAFKLKSRTREWISKMVDSIHFIPLSVIAYILLSVIIFGSRSGFAHSTAELIMMEVIVLTVLVIPLTTVLIGKDINHVLQNEFILSAKVLGGGSFHVFWRHVMPHIGPKMTVLFGQQFIQVLVIFIHLGFFHIFLGGTIIETGLLQGPPRSTTNEWSGLIGANKYAFKEGRYYLLGFVLLAFMLSIFAMQFIIQGVKEVQQVKIGIIYKFSKLKRRKKFKNKEITEVSKEKLQFKECLKEQQRDLL